MRFNTEFIREVMKSYVAMYFTIFSFIVAETYLSYAKGEITIE